MNKVYHCGNRPEVVCEAASHGAVETPCETCENLVAIGEGEHICYECGEPFIMPIAGYVPTSDYLKCGGAKYE